MTMVHYVEVVHVAEPVVEGRGQSVALLAVAIERCSGDLGFGWEEKEQERAQSLGCCLPW